MWYTLAIIAAILTSIMVLGIKFAITRGLNPAFILFLSFSMSALMAFLHMNLKKIEAKLDWLSIVIIIGAGVLSYIANLLLTNSIKIAPNPGYSQAILSTNIVIISIVSFFLFNSEFSPKNIIGSLICLLGVVILSI